MRAIRLLAAACLVACAAAAQSTPPGQFVFKLNVGDVLLHATVLDRQNRPVLTLPQADFEVYENDVAQKIAYFAQEDAPISLGIVVDNSGSMRPKRQEVSTAVINLVQSSNPQDEVFVVNFNDQYFLDAPFTNSIPRLQAALDQLDSQGATALYDAIVASEHYLSQNAKHDKKILLVVTDGVDNASRYNLDQAVRIAQAENGPMIYCIGLLDGDSGGEKPLKEFAQYTGGLAFFPKSLNQVDTITQQVSKEIRSQYTISYHSSLTAAGYRAIRVEVKDAKQKNLSVRTRAGYYLDQSTENAPSRPGAAGGVPGPLPGHR